MISTIIFNSNRPILFYENNFELMFLALLLYLYFVLKGKVEFIYQFIIGLTFLLSASISGLIILFFVLFFINYNIIVKKIFYLVPIFVALCLVAASVIAQRTGGEIDLTKNVRFKFLLIFLNETKDWNFFDFLVGSDRISALSREACSSLSYWQSLFSYKNDGTCYSVILHSYILRVIYDHGVLGLFFIIGYLFKLIKVAKYKSKHAFVIIGVVFINGLSVSSFNSIYFIMGLLFFLVISRQDEEVNQYKKAFVINF
tara:strand:+ start:1195 stop:1965 length:771 start_codon:yes stop_codon:yes gene_type:complete